jgi:hypothetical protein
VETPIPHRIAALYGNPRLSASALAHFAGDLWLARGPSVRFFGVPLPTRAIVARLADGSVWINSPVETSEEVNREITSIGPVHYLIAPNGYHVWRLEGAQARYPGAQFWVPPKLPKAFRSLNVAGVLGDDAPAAWSSDFEQLVFRGNPFIEEVVFFHAKTRTVIVGDLIQNYPTKQLGFFGAALARLENVLDGGVPRDIALSFNFGKHAARQSLERLLSWDFDRLIVAHGRCIERDAKPFVIEAFRWLQR